LPWFVVMLIGAMAACSIIYIVGMRDDLGSRYGDSRTATALMPATVAKAGESAAVDGGQLQAIASGYGNSCALEASVLKLARSGISR
jgi:hypothetical protein